MIIYSNSLFIYGWFVSQIIIVICYLSFADRNGWYKSVYRGSLIILFLSSLGYAFKQPLIGSIFLWIHLAIFILSSIYGCLKIYINKYLKKTL